MATSTEIPKLERRLTRPSISSRPSGSRPAVGSSRRTRAFGSATRAWASLVRWRMPVENPPIGRKRASSSPTRSSTSDARWRVARGGSPAISPSVDTASDADWSSGRQSCSGMNPEASSRDFTDFSATGRPATSMVARRPQQPEGEAQQGRLAGAVGADEAHRAARHLHGETVERHGAALVDERQGVGAQQRGVRAHRSSGRAAAQVRRDLGWVRVGVQPARLGSTYAAAGPTPRSCQPSAACRSPVAARQPVTPQKATVAGRSSSHRGLQAEPARPGTLGVELGGPDRRPLDEIGEARAVVAEGVPGVAVHRCDAGRQGRRPEPVAGPGVGDLGVGGVQARVQAAHQQAEAPAHDVGQRALPGGDDLDRVVGDGEGVDGEPGPVQEPGEGFGLPPGEQAAREVVVLVADLLVDPTLLRTEHGEPEAPAHCQGPADVTEGGRQVDGRHVLQALPGPDAGEAFDRNGSAVRSWRATGTSGAPSRARRHIASATSVAMSGRPRRLP